MSDWQPSGERQRSRSASPRRAARSRSRSPRRDDGDRGRSQRQNGERGDVNPGNNLHVSGLSTRVEDRDLEEIFAKYGRIQKCQIMFDPHTRESRGFAFVTMETAEEAEAAIAGLNATEISGRTINVEKARRGRARTPTPGQYHGPPKASDYGRGDYRPYEPSRYGGGGYSRYDDRPPRGGYDRGYDSYARPMRDDRYDDYSRSRRDDRRDYDRRDDYYRESRRYDDRDRRY